MDILNLSPFLVVPFFILNNDRKMLVKYLLNFLVLNPVLKYCIFRPLVGSLGHRPTGGSACLSGYGMPSGHSQALAFFAAYVFYSPKSTDYRRLAAVLLMLAVMYSRVENRCHTVPQVIVGAVIGWLVYNFPV